MISIVQHGVSAAELVTRKLRALGARPGPPLAETLRLDRVQAHDAGDDVLAQAEGAALGLVVSGVIGEVRLFGDARRQIVSLRFPGDTVAPGDGETPVALTRASLADGAPLMVRLADRSDDTLGLRRAWVAAARTDQAILRDHVVRLGRMSAFERIGHVLLEMHERLALVGLATENTFHLPLTQEVMSDFLGLSAVHLNRTLQSLRRAGLVSLRQGYVTLTDRPRLIAVAGYVSRYPAARETEGQGRSASALGARLSPIARAAAGSAQLFRFPPNRLFVFRNPGNPSAAARFSRAEVAGASDRMFPALRLAQLGEFSPQFPDAEALHQGLARWNRVRLAPAAPSGDWRDRLRRDHVMLEIEGAFIEAFRRHVAPLAANVPSEAGAFVEWFEGLRDSGPGQWDPLFDWLATTATREQMQWFLTQEAAGEAGFDDLVALTQVKLPEQAKLELARNYWDEMGRGSAAGMHGPMLERTVEELELSPSIEGTCWQSLALANTMTAFATTRRYAYQSVGALGAVELTAPTRVGSIADGLKRLECPPVARKYFQLHAHLDVEHSRAWNAEALYPLVAEDPARARHIAEGAIMRLICGEQCFEAYRAHLWAHVHPIVYAAE